MPVTADDVRNAYYTMLGRLPENNAALEFHVNASASLQDLYTSLAGSDEFLLNIRGSLCSPFTLDHIAFLRRFADPERKPVEGFVVDFLGVKTDCRFRTSTIPMSGFVDRVPVPRDVRGWGAYEWIGALRAVDEASDRFTAIELGAGWGPWLIAGARAARAKGISDIDLAGVEGDNMHFTFMLAHFVTNGEDPDKHQLMHGVVAPQSGAALFPIDDNPVYAWAQEPKFFATRAAAKDALASTNGRYQVLDAFSLPEIVRERRRVDLLHVDIQGSEADLVEANTDLLCRRVSRVVIGTHGRDIELRLRHAFKAMGWSCEFEHPCEYAVPDFTLIEDGTQVWKNPRFGSSSR
jgi:hypothetical protein